ncbi:MAG TPA: cation:proton antiporter, partial [Azospira sp.]|nr:cation:proton antiporter [Azospira sp.]
HPLYLLLGSVLLGSLAARLVLWGARLLGKGPESKFSQFILLAGMLLTAVGLAHVFNLSVFLALLVFGLACRQWDSRYALLSVDLGGAAQLFYIVLFVLTGASLPLAAVPAAGLPVLAYLAARSLGKAAGVMLTAPFSRISWRQHAWLGLALLPMSGVAIALVHDLTSLHPQFGERLGNLVLAAVVLLEFLGPLAVQAAFRGAGESRPEEKTEGAAHA